MRGVFKTTLKRFLKSKEGVASIEFVFIFPLAVFLIGAIMFLGVFFFKISTADAAVRDAANRIMTVPNATAAQVQTIFEEETSGISGSTQNSTSSIVVRADGVRMAVFNFEFEVMGDTPMFNTKGWKHVSSVQVPILDM